MKRPDKWTTLRDLFSECNCPYVYILGYYLSKFDKRAYEKLGFGNTSKTHEKIGNILKVPPNTVRNCRDKFDPYHPNPRRGWYQMQLSGIIKAIIEGFGCYSEEEFYALATKILNKPNLSCEELFDSFNVGDERLIFPDEVGEAEETKTLKEGSVRQVKVNAYERNNQARKKCIEHYGLNCCVCGFSFEKAFGELGKGFIHVHHLIPLSKINQEYEVDPIQDLRPVCPNCHAMIHSKSPPLTIKQLKYLLNINS